MQAELVEDRESVVRPLGAAPLLDHPLQAVQNLYDFVNAFEDPLEGTGLSRSDLTPEALDLVDRMHALSQKARMELVGPPELGSLPAAVELAMLHDGLGHVLGKNFFKKIGKAVIKIHKTIAKKVEKVAKNPIFLAVAGAVVNVVPGVGQLASAALLAAAASRKVYAQKVDEKKAKKKQTAAQKQADAAYQAQIVDYNTKVAAQYAAAGQPIPVGALLDAAGNASVDPRTVPGYQSSWNATLPPGAPPSPGAAASPATVTSSSSAVAQGVAFAGAASLNGDSSSGAAITNQLMQDLPPDVAQEAAQMIPQMQTALQDPNVKAASLKAIGQFVATQELSAGLGMGGVGSPEQQALARGILQEGDPAVQAAITAGEQDLVTSGAVGGNSAALQQAIKDGRAALLATPWTTYAAVGGVVVAAGTGAFLWLKS